MQYSKIISTKFGKLTIIASDIGLEAILFEDEKIPQIFEGVKKTQAHEIILHCEKELKEYFDGKRKVFSVKLNPQGTDFQKKVWKYLLQIPYGITISYKDESIGLKNPKAIRAIAAANGKNKIPIIIPCHRVIASNNHLHGYAGGLDLKKRLLELEGIEICNFVKQG